MEETLMEETAPRIGDLVDAEYVTGISGKIALLRGIVTGVSERDGKPAYSVQGDGQGTTRNTMPVYPLAPFGSTEAVAFAHSVASSSRSAIERANLVRQLSDNPVRLARAVVNALTVAGANAVWDSETIEHVLDALMPRPIRAALPYQIDSNNDAALTYWRGIADVCGIEHDGEGEE